MATYYRRDEEVVTDQGNPVSGVQIALATQPAITGVFPPTPAVRLFADAVGTPLRVNPPQTDQNGHCSYYALQGIYTVVYYSTEIATPTQTIVLTDQAISGPTNLPSFNSDSTVNGSIVPNPNGVTVGFTLSAAPTPPASLVLTLNGLVLSAFAFSGQTIVLETPPPVGSVLNATYQV
jgi:hypothetical protein